MKICCKCGIEKPLEEYGKSSRNKDGHVGTCKICKNTRARELYQDWDKERINSKGETRMNCILRNKQFVVDHLKLNCCIDCGESDIVLLDFDHIDTSTKISSVSDLIRGGSMERLETEMSKCEVRCVSCHRRRTAKQFNWYKGITF